MAPSSSTELITLYAGKEKKPFQFHKRQLESDTDFFDKFRGEQLFFEDVNAETMSLFHRWCTHGPTLFGPHDFQSMEHYIDLYTLSRRFELEPLENHVMDLIRHYYRVENLIAPAHRLEGIYHTTNGANMLRHFLISTAAFRLLCEAPEALTVHLSDAFRKAVVQNNEIAVDCIEALIHLHKDGVPDPRHGIDCDWHRHGRTEACPIVQLEPWQTDGPSGGEADTVLKL